MKSISLLSTMAAAAYSLAPLQNNGEVIADSYLVVFKGDAQVDAARALSTSHDAKYFYNMKTFKGFAATLDADALLAVRNSPLVEFVEMDQVIRVNYETQTNPTWGLDRVDQPQLPLDSEYKYIASGAEDVEAYIIDTGIRNSHNDFGGRSFNGYDFHNGNSDSNDDNGHGTHVAGTVGGTVYGMAKSVELYGVKVLGALGSGSTANVVAGVEFAAANCRNNERCVANMSLGGGASAAMDNAVNDAVRSGVSMVLASGNSNANACNSSPARTGGPNGIAITVNAADNRDSRATFSNYGTCTDIFAPGVSITSAWHTSNTATNTISGTSMASPHVAGSIALIVARGNANPDAAKREMNNDAIPNVISNPGSGSPNMNLFGSYEGH